MDQHIDKMIENYINTYMNSEKGQKILLLTMTNICNNKNLEEILTLSITNTVYKFQIDELKHIANGIQNILKTDHFGITTEQCKILCDTVIEISKTITTINSSASSKTAVQRSINQLYQNILPLDITQKPMTFEEFLMLTEDDVADIEIQHTLSCDYPERASESKLKKYGYSVAYDSPLSNKKRQELLKHLIERGEVSKGYVISYLKHNIQINGKKESNEFAVSKWKDDLDFVYKL